MFDFNAFADLIADKVAERLGVSTDDVLTPAQAAELMGLHVNTINRMADAGEIPGRKYGERWRFRKSALLNHISDSARARERQPLRIAGD